MAGTDTSKAPAATVRDGGGPAIVLVRPQLGENVGFAARAMLNCGLTDLRLVAPRDGWPNEKASVAAAGADSVIEGARLYDTAAAAVTDLNLVHAATARARDMLKPEIDPRRAAEALRAADAAGVATGILFGPERSGLTNDEVTLADAVVTVPLNPAFASLQLGHAVMILGYEWYQGGVQALATDGIAARNRPATKSELLGFFEHLERELDACGFLRVAEMRPTVVRNIRNMFQRAGLTEQEVRTLRGIVKGLVVARGRNRGGE